FQLEGMNALGIAGDTLHGILGYNILARYRMEFNFAKDKMTWTRLNHDPALPRRIAKKGQESGSLDAIGSIVKAIGMLVEKPPPENLAPRGFLGVELAPAEGKVEGVLIKAVLAKGPAAQAGLQAGDLITEFQGEEVSDIAEVQSLAAKVRAGKKARF